jgi:hypothetical protein
MTMRYKVRIQLDVSKLDYNFADFIDGLSSFTHNTSDSGYIYFIVYNTIKREKFVDWSPRLHLSQAFRSG